MTATLNPPPIQERVIDQHGYINNAWAKFFQSLQTIAISTEVSGPSTSVTSNIVEFADTTGVVLKDGGLTHANVTDAISKKHTQGTDTTLGTMAADIDMNSNQLTNLAAPAANGEAIRQTATITEASLGTVISSAHTQGTDTTLGTMSDDIVMNMHQLIALAAPDNLGEAIRQTATVTENNLISSVLTNRGHKFGLTVTIKDVDELYVAGGVIEINDVVYSVDAQLTVAIGSVTAATLYYIYVNAPTTGTVLAATEFTLSTTAATFDDDKNGYYKTGDGTKRLLAKYYQTGGIITEQITAEADDGFWTPGGATFDNGTGGNNQVWVGDGYAAYFRFQTLAMEYGDIVTSATFSAKVGWGTGPVNLTVYCNDIDDAANPTSVVTADGLTLTTTSKNWTVVGSTNVTYTTSDISLVIQAVVDRIGFATNNALMIILKDNSSGTGKSVAFQGYRLGLFTTLAIVIDGTSKAVNDQTIFLAQDSDNALNSEDLLIYDTVLGGVRGIEKSTDGTLEDNSDYSIPTEKAVKTYADLRLLISEIDDVPVDGVVVAPISSNWAYDHTNATAPHISYRYATATAKRYYHVALGASNPGASGAAWVDASANTTGGWRLTNAIHLLRGQVDVHSDWDAASDLTFSVNFMVNVDNTGGGVGDTVDLKATVYYKGVGDTATKSQTVEVATVVGQSAQYKQFKASFTIDFDAASNVVEAGDVLAIVLNLETDTSEVDDVVITSMEFYYNTTHVGIEATDV